MRKKILVATLLLFVLATGCERNSHLPKRTNEMIELGSINNHLINAEQANKIAILHSIFPNGLKSELRKNNLMGSYTNGYELKKQKPGKTIKNNFSINGKGDFSACYVINYNEGGFVIVSGDDRMMPVLAFSDKDNFTISDPKKMLGGIDIWMESNLNYIDDLRSGKQHEQKSVSSAWLELEHESQISLGNFTVLNDFPPCDEENLWNLHTVRDSFTLATAQWGQSAPYNAMIPLESCGAPKVGCVATAVSIIMKYHHFPTTYNWSLMNSGSDLFVQYLMYDNHALTGTTSDCGESLANWWRSEDLLEDSGFSTDGFDDFSISTVINDLYYGRPVILRGVQSGNSSGHQWVTDG